MRIPNCTEWHMLWITVFSRMVRHNITDVLEPLQTLLDPLMTLFLKLLEVPTGKTKPQRYDQLGWPSDCDFLLHGKKDKAKVAARKQKRAGKDVLRDIYDMCPEANSGVAGVTQNGKEFKVLSRKLISLPESIGTLDRLEALN